jgi:hypothetical protein
VSPLKLSVDTSRIPAVDEIIKNRSLHFIKAMEDALASIRGKYGAAFRALIENLRFFEQPNTRSQMVITTRIL